MTRSRNALGPWIVLGLAGWAALAWIGWVLWQNNPPRAGFDLTLLLDAARKVLNGQSPYDPAILAGASPDAVSLFYSYPPPVAQAMTLLAWLPDGVALILWGSAATLSLGYIASRLATVADRDPVRTAIQAICVAPLVFPFAIAVLFGNLDVWYPLAYGAVLLAALPGSSRRGRILAGVALGAIIVAKLQPAPMLLWLLILAWRPGRPVAGTRGLGDDRDWARHRCGEPRGRWRRALARLHEGRGRQAPARSSSIPATSGPPRSSGSSPGRTRAFCAGSRSSCGAVIVVMIASARWIQDRPGWPSRWWLRPAW